MAQNICRPLWAINPYKRGRNRAKEFGSEYYITGKDLSIFLKTHKLDPALAWATYSVANGNFTKAITSPGQERYELFCFGYLYFYDNHVLPQSKEPHIMYFDWSLKGDSVNIYLWPEADQKVKDPQYGLTHLYDQNGKRKTDSMNQLANTSDPPPPPPPPPPPVDN